MKRFTDLAPADQEKAREYARKRSADGASYLAISRELALQGVRVSSKSIGCWCDAATHQRHRTRRAGWRRARRKNDPEFRERDRKRVHERDRRKRQTDAEFRRRCIQNGNRRRRERYATDPEFRDKINKRRQTLYHTNLSVRLADLLRGRLRAALRGNHKAGSAVRDLGCTVKDLRAYLESLFAPGMSWDNHGSVWHIDHKRPLASFDLTDREQFLQACHYTNLQPLWAFDNMSKGAKLLA